MSRLVFALTEVQRQELCALRDHSEKPYLRERAAALLKVAAGMSANAVGKHGLLRTRQQRTVATWVHRYQQDGSAGLVAKPRGHRGYPPGRGRTGAAGSTTAS